jgi:hypothetical protein
MAGLEEQLAGTGLTRFPLFADNMATALIAP